ncbi:MAG: hypothetical protein H7174_03505 [Flavobacterium sp.]|nr:hypothetical protein [Flavobacterium sp.]
MRKIYFILFLVVVILNFSCTSRTIQELQPQLQPTIIATYNGNVKPIMTNNCINCHANGNQYPNLDTFVEVKEATKNGQVICRINGNCGDVMPQSGKMPQQTIDLIELWKTQGYLE